MGITKTPSALSRWTLSYNLRSQIADETNKMFGLRHEDKFSHNELTPARKHRDNTDELLSAPFLKSTKFFTRQLIQIAFTALLRKTSSRKKFNVCY